MEVLYMVQQGFPVTFAPFPIGVKKQAKALLFSGRRMP